MTIQDLLGMDGTWKPKDPKPNHAGLILHGTGKAHMDRITYNGVMLPGVYRAEYTAKVGELDKLTLWAYGRDLDLSAFDGAINVNVTKGKP